MDLCRVVLGELESRVLWDCAVSLPGQAWRGSSWKQNQKEALGVPPVESRFPVNPPLFSLPAL